MSETPPADRRSKNLEKRCSTTEARRKNVVAFTMYCQGHTGPDICKRLDLASGTLKFWQYSQKWTEARRRVALGEAYHAPFSDPDERDQYEMPESHEDLLSCILVTKDIIRFKLGGIMEKMTDAANKQDGESLYEKAGDFQKLTASFKNIFPEKSEQDTGPSVSVNITAGGILSSVIPENEGYETQLPIIDVEEVEDDLALPDAQGM